MRYTPIFVPLLLMRASAALDDALDMSTLIASKQTCITHLKSTAEAASPLPTCTKTSAQTVYSTITTGGTASTITTTITPEAVTATQSFNATGDAASETVFVTVPAKAARTCSTTTTVSVNATTVYTGSYNGTIAKRTASLLDRKHPVDRRWSSLQVNLFHHYGQNAIGISQKAIAIQCVEQITTYVITTSTNAEEPTTETFTADTPTVFVTQLDKVTMATAPVSITSTITAPAPANTNVSGVCTETLASSTTTQHLKCAPTNLIGSVNGYGIGQTGGSSANTRGLAPGSDPSACCQLCVDDEDCAASEDDPDAGNCFLWYTTPSCGEGFQYSDGGQDLAPGAGFLVQTGCGTIEATDSS